MVTEFFKPEYRQISLVHGLYKYVVGKFLSSWLRKVMPSPISPTQTAFIVGRQILDVFMIANEVVHSIEKGGQHGFILKMDLHKAFDSIM